MTEPAEPPDPELWIARTPEGWRLEIRTTGEADGDGGTVHVVPLQHREAAASAPVFTASVHATAAETGRLELRWGRQAWSSDFRFDELPPHPPRRPRVSGRGTPRQAADDNSPTARNNMLNERNETALVLPDGARISMLYWKGIDVEDEDYPTLAETPDGEVVDMIRAPVLRLKSDVSLRFGDAGVPTGNLAPGFAGAYGVWLRRAGAGWRFVFNHEPDSWGTQHDPDFDAAETPVEYSRAAGSFRPLGATPRPHRRRPRPPRRPLGPPRVGRRLHGRAGSGRLEAAPPPRSRQTATGRSGLPCAGFPAANPVRPRAGSSRRWRRWPCPAPLAGPSRAQPRSPIPALPD